MTETHTAWYTRHRSLLVLGVLLLIQWGCWRLLPDPATTWILDDIKDQLLTVSTPEGTILDPSKIIVVHRSKDPASSNWPILNVAGVQYVKLIVITEGINDTSEWLFQYQTRNAPYYDDAVIHSRTLKPLINHIGAKTELTWQLPVTAEMFRIVIPKAARFTVAKLQLAGLQPDQTLLHTWRQAIIVLCFALNASLLVSWLAQYAQRIRSLCLQPAFISTLILALHGSLMIWLLPPFQGPDENRHWKQAMRLYRSDGQPGSLLYRLPVILDAESPRLRSESPFHAANLHAMPTVPHEQGENREVGYVQHWGYPIVGLVSLLFPPVQTLNEALIFYYSCRVVALVILLALVATAWRIGLGSWTLVIFLSFPLVMQQCIVVSTDTVLNLGTLLAVILFRRHYLARTTASLVALIVVCLLIVAAKPPIYLPILLLPACFLPWPKLLKPAIWIPALLAIIFIGTAGLWYLWNIVSSEGMGIADQAHKQLDYVLTGPGLTQFTYAAMEYPTRFLHPEHWWEPLGWLDTNLTELHKALLWISLFSALALDLSRWITWLLQANLRCLWSLILPMVFCVLNLLFVWWSLALVMYLTITDYQSAGIVGMQVRYMLPVVLLFLTWPSAHLPRLDQPTQQRWLWPIIMLLILAIARAILLAGDLQHRYWG